MKCYNDSLFVFKDLHRSLRIESEQYEDYPFLFLYTSVRQARKQFRRSAKTSVVKRFLKLCVLSHQTTHCAGLLLFGEGSSMPRTDLASTCVPVG